ncbi:MAG: hypothetical protein ACYTGX_09730 [Planctomycetota bacterium]|jgi:hypothetical protein
MDAATPARRKPGVARPSLLVGGLSVAGAGWNWVLNSAVPDLLNTASRVDAATGSATKAVAGTSSVIATAGPAISQAVQGACLGAISVVLSSVLLRARTGKARAAAAVAMTVGAVTAEPLVFASQWLPAGVLESWTTQVDLAIKHSAMEYVSASTGQIESAALAAGVLFPGVILAIKSLFWVTKQDTRREVWRLNVAAVDWATTGTAAFFAACFAWWALALSQPLHQPGDPPDDDDGEAHG